MNSIIRWLAHVFKVNRGVLLFVLALVAMFGMANRALASEYPLPTDEQAWESCNADAVGAVTPRLSGGSYYLYKCNGPHYDHGSSSPYYLIFSDEIWNHYHFPVATLMPECEGATHGDPPDPNRNPDGTCKAPPADEEDCEALQAQTSGEGNDSLMTFSGTFPQCRGGCNFGPTGPTTRTVFAGDTITTSDFGFDGTTCPATPDLPPPAAPPETPTAEVCKPAGDGQTFCTKQDGKQCYTAGSTGKQICWDKGETGTKTEQNIAQVRAPGTSTPPAPTPPPGETMNQVGTSTTTTTTTTINNVTTTTTTTVINYGTTNGTNAGTVNQGETPNAGGGSSSSSGESVSGIGNDCSLAYTCSGDAIDCAILTEQRMARCAGEKLGKSMTASEISAIEGDGDGDNPASADAAGLHEAESYSTGDLDSGGFLGGGRSCPIVAAPMFFDVAIPLPNDVLCTWLSIGSYLILAFAGLACLRIIRGV